MADIAKFSTAERNASVDKEFLKTLADWRERLASHIALRNTFKSDFELAEAVQARKIMFERITSCVERGENFAIEITLSEKNYARDIPRWRKNGYVVKLFFLQLPSPELAIERVKNRVALGGHHIPDDVIRRRFATRLCSAQR